MSTDNGQSSGMRSGEWVTVGWKETVDARLAALESKQDKVLSLLGSPDGADDGAPTGLHALLVREAAKGGNDMASWIRFAMLLAALVASTYLGSR